MAQRVQVPSRDDVELQSQPFAYHAALEVQWKQSVVATLDHRGGHVGPGVERPWLLEWGVRLARLWLPESLLADVGGHVVKEVLDLVEVLVAQPNPPEVGEHRLLLSSGLPPLTRRLARPWCHRVDEHD